MLLYIDKRESGGIGQSTAEAVPVSRNMIIDFHSHILPGMDDGARNVSVSGKMLHLSRRAHTAVQALTPHYYPWREEAGRFLERRDQSYLKLCGELSEEWPQLLLLGAEVAFFPGMSELELSPFCLDGERLLLVELPFRSWDSQVTDVLAQLTLDRGYHVILAHVERFVSYRGNKEKILSLGDLPITMQMNCESFLPLFKRRAAFRLAEELKPVLLGTDAHGVTERVYNMKEGRAALSEHFGKAFLKKTDRCGETLLRNILK